ncbi:cyd operon YbgE family protein [Acidihalobacter ferrooxydans]|uniref:Uncharacterized protein n=1 Tax=Acidihalobacter ferrooxydans TaxID=1765967 RepID=A0A1P8UHY5_9GAMM|nr:cyd operon YbgE family protein [Acidihalobacter ferrooxydans]APZ43446.1 hypothetical protein BW247_10400 [Acidihalobacter ferrooxydans]
MQTGNAVRQLVNMLALCGGIAIFALVLMNPWTVATAPPGVRETLFALMVVGSALGFAYGLGFRAETGLFKWIFTPITVFTTILLALAWISYALSAGYGHMVTGAGGTILTANMHLWRMALSS